ncbi:MAG: penicillin-binding protein 2, partial [Thermoleophilaceae bacterium]|nr:penicillin-binding protein 2 [Thermoleophilaceae bacterium]
ESTPPQAQAARANLRIAALGIFVLAIFAIVFFRLWFLQVLSGDQNLAQANDNRVREVKVEAPRGKIVDRNGNLLVGNRGSWAVQVDPRRFESDEQIYVALRKLAPVLGEPFGRLKRRYKDGRNNSQFTNPTVAVDVSFARVAKLQESQEQHPGITVAKTFVRSYPRDNLAAQLFGYVREINEKQLGTSRYEGAKLGDRVGQDGLEREYDKYLRGVSGVQRVEVDVGNQARSALPGVEPTAGKTLRLTLDLGVQKAAEQAMSLVAPGKRGAFVVMDVKSGEVLALGSKPTFDPAIYTGLLRPATYKRLSSPDGGQPLINRAISAQYPPGSTFKLISGLAALENGLVSPGTTIADGGKIKFGGQEFKNAGGAANGSVDMRSALKVSSDVYFYLLGLQQYRKKSELIQTQARRLGLDRTTGIDLPGEADGRMPDRKWCATVKKETNGAICRYGWLPGYDIQLAVGQGDVLVTPLQMALAYATVANNGYLVRPHLGLRVDKPTGQVEQELQVSPRRKVALAPSFRSVMLDGMRAAASEPGGTSADVFAGFPIKIAGKTGTAEVIGKEDQSWYLALAPYPDPRYVVAVTVEQGGFGAKAAAPIARLILAELYNVSLKEKVVTGESRTR